MVTLATWVLQQLRADEGREARRVVYLEMERELSVLQQLLRDLTYSSREEGKRLKELQKHHRRLGGWLEAYAKLCEGKRPEQIGVPREGRPSTVPEPPKRGEEAPPKGKKALPPKQKKQKPWEVYGLTQGQWLMSLRKFLAGDKGAVATHTKGLLRECGISRVGVLMTETGGDLRKLRKLARGFGPQSLRYLGGKLAALKAEVAAPTPKTETPPTEEVSVPPSPVGDATTGSLG